MDVLGFLSKRSRVAIVAGFILLYQPVEFIHSCAKITPIVVELNPRSFAVKLKHEPEKE